MSGGRILVTGVLIRSHDSITMDMGTNLCGVLMYKPPDNANSQKLLTEYEKYQELQARSQRLQEVTPSLPSHQ